MSNVVEKMAQIGLDFKDTEKARLLRRNEVLHTLSIMPDKNILMKPGDAEMLADLTEAAVIHILEIMADRILAARTSLGTILGPDLLGSLISKYVSIAMSNMQNPLLDNVVAKRALLLATAELPDNENITLLGKDEGIAFIKERDCPCPSCDETVKQLETGEFLLVTRDGEYLGLRRKETVQ